MKLICLYIENFGGLHRFSLEFEAGITSVIESNGFGKTTLAEFIRAMFYGFPRKSKTLDRSLRQKYMPWNGGQFGGNLVFELAGQHYRIERTFGTNPKGDTFSVIDLESGRKTGRFTEEIGQELFGMDAESFERSTYLPQLKEHERLTTASIQAKLSDLVEDNGDVVNFDKAMAALKAERSNLIPYRGGGGILAETGAAITALQFQLDALRAKQIQQQKAHSDVELAREGVERTKKLLAKTSEQLQIALRQEAENVHRQRYTQLCDRYSENEARIRNIRKKYPAGFPQETALRRAELAAERLSRQQEALRGTESVPTQEQLEACRGLCKAYEILQMKLHDLQRRMEEATGELASGRETTISRRNSMAVAMVACGIAGCTAGAALFWLRRGYSAVFLAASALLLAAGIVRLRIRRGTQKELRARQRTAQNNLAMLRQQADETDRESEKYRREIGAFFDQFGLSVQPWQYHTVLAELERRCIRTGAQRKEMLTAKEELRSFFADLDLPCGQDFYSTLQQLREDMQTLQTAKALSQALKEQIAAAEKAGGDVLFTEDLPVRDSVYFRCEEKKQRMELTAQTTAMLQAEQEVLRLQEALSVLPEVCAELEQAQRKLMEDREKVKILDATMDFLQQARENLATSYMDSIRSRFGYYLAMLGYSDERYLVDTELRIQLERQGKARELAYFSTGQTDLVMLCMRFALVDALFRNQEMFIILDDPFVNLDDVHMEQAQLLLRKLAADRQILYLSCHSGRTI